MKNKAIKDIIKTAVSLFLICAVAAGILGYVNSVTSPTIASNAKKAADKARAELIAADSFEEISLSDGKTAYKGVKDGKTAGYVFTTSASSYGGALEVMTGIDADGKITGINILSINDTPGLGMNAKKDSFKNQFIEKSGTLSVTKSGSAGDSEINAITSATITSKAVTSAVNEAVSLFNEAKAVA